MTLVWRRSASVQERATLSPDGIKPLQETCCRKVFVDSPCPPSPDWHLAFNKKYQR